MTKSRPPALAVKFGTRAEVIDSLCGFDPKHGFEDFGMAAGFGHADIATKLIYTDRPELEPGRCSSQRCGADSLKSTQVLTSSSCPARIRETCVGSVHVANERGV